MIIKMPKQVEFILDQLGASGFEAYIVGGCVRDSLIGKEPHDWDICTSALPKEVITAFWNEDVVETGIEYGTVTLMLDGVGYEVTTFRKETGYSDGRHPDSVEFTLDIKEDLKRRDFTINSMAYSHENGLVDLYGGWKDLLNGELRCVGDAGKRFEEDALRILRAIRFAVVFGLEIEENTFKEMIAHKDKISAVSLERVTSEFEKIFSGNKSILKVFTQCSEIISEIIPEIRECVGFNQNNKHNAHEVYEHMLYVCDGCDTTDFAIKMAGFLHDIGKPQSYTVGEDGCGHFYGHPDVSHSLCERLLVKRFRLRNSVKAEIETLVKYHDLDVARTRKSVKRALNKMGEELFRKWIILKTSDRIDHIGTSKEDIISYMSEIEDILNGIISEQECFSLKDLAIKGSDLIGIGYMPGVTLGKTLNWLLDLVINGEPNTKENLTHIAKERMQNEFN